jgi:hypothetical protein
MKVHMILSNANTQSQKHSSWHSQEWNIWAMSEILREHIQWVSNLYVKAFQDISIGMHKFTVSIKGLMTLYIKEILVWAIWLQSALEEHTYWHEHTLVFMDSNHKS